MKRLTRCMAFVLIAILIMSGSVSAAQLLIPGGQLIGLSLDDRSVTVSAVESDTPLQVGDRLISINGQPVHSTDQVKDILANCDGQLQLRVLRKGQERDLQQTALATADGPKLGVRLKEGVTGVGTVTYYDPRSGSFGALGHGVNDSAGRLLHMEKGQVYHAGVLSVRKGKTGEPGQLMGSLAGCDPIGTLRKNSDQGIFGQLEQEISGEKLPVAQKDQVRTGHAVIRSTIGDGGIQEYSVEILKIYPNPKCASRNMLLRITDERLLTTTGGIVQGMSGSPIIQDGKLIGAVTHVLVNDPTTGYGIFIENMLDAAA